MPENKRPKKKLPKVVMTADMDKNKVTVTYGRAVSTMKQNDRQLYLNITLAGVDASLKKLLGKLPTLRPATEEEREAKIYVMINDAEMNLSKGREQLYHTIAGIFNNTLSELFPDVEYVEQCRKYQQETIFDMSSEEATEYQKEIEDVTILVREKVAEEGETDGRDDEGKTS